MVFNEEQAEISGLNVTLLNYLFIILATVSIVISIRLIGILMVSSLLIIPNVAALLLGYGFKKTLLLSACFSVLSVVIGIILSYEINVAPSGMIVLVSTGIFFSLSASKSVASKLPQNKNQ
ncbi:MAG: metal ABC transporter permease [Nitrosopumilus sp.]|nr:metal ABC transporter permease [Nitrosopumilus sp.]